MIYATNIDTIGLQIDCIDTSIQKDVLYGLLGFIMEIDSLYLGHRDYMANSGLRRREYSIFSNNTTIATINTGNYRTGSYHDDGYSLRYYVSIKFAGLKRFNKVLDDASNFYLFRICAYLNTRNISFKLTELDICLDLECPFENILAICVKKSPKTQYYNLMDTQAYGTTKYIEKLTKKQLNKAVLRAYTYNKSYKENLSIDITRFELKLQSNYFNKYGFNIESIEKALNRYYIMYFKDVEEKYSKIGLYNNYKNIRKRELERLGLKENRLYPNIHHIQNFIDTLLYCTLDGHYNNSLVN